MVSHAAPQTVTEANSRGDAATVALARASALSLESSTPHARRRPTRPTPLLARLEFRLEVWLAGHVGAASSHCGEQPLTDQPTESHSPLIPT